MPTTRYFKSTDGKKTFFRASPTRVYRSMSTDHSFQGWSFHQYDHAPFPVVEITRQEYKALIALKAARIERDKAAYRADHPDQEARHLGYWGTAPRDSWVRNTDIV